MIHRKNVGKAILFAAAGLMLLALQMTGAQDALARAEQCPDGGVKIESGPWELWSGNGPITSVCIKSGNQTFLFEKDGDDGCYSVKGLGTDHVTVGGGGTGRDCKAISHVVFYGGKK